MEIEAAIVAKLKADTDVDTDVGGRIAATRIPDALPRPNVVYERIGTERTVANDGPAGLVRATVQVSCYADSYAVAKSLAKKIRVALNGFRGTIGTLKVQSLLLDDERDAPVPASVKGVVGVNLTFAAAYNE
jgi:hypothetical protein